MRRFETYTILSCLVEPGTKYVGLAFPNYTHSVYFIAAIARLSIFVAKVRPSPLIVSRNGHMQQSEENDDMAVLKCTEGLTDIRKPIP